MKRIKYERVNTIVNQIRKSCSKNDCIYHPNNNNDKADLICGMCKHLKHRLDWYHKNEVI